MDRIVHFLDKKISYSIKGHGPAILFIHGYLESKKIWGGFIDRFTQTNTVIAPDIPGHGISEIIDSEHSMSLMTDVLLSILQAENINKVMLVGHSMGGYIAMEFVSRFPEYVSGLCLLHSTCFADSEEKKLNRDREISLVRCGKKMQIIHTNIPKAFSTDNLQGMDEEVGSAKDIAAACPDDGIIALLQGMKERSDHSETLNKCKVPTLLVWGQKDNYISEDVFNKLRNVAPHADILILPQSGHMGFLEEPDKVFSGLSHLLSNLQS